MSHDWIGQAVLTAGVLQQQQSAILLLVAGEVTNYTLKGKDAKHLKPLAIGAIGKAILAISISLEPLPPKQRLIQIYQRQASWMQSAVQLHHVEWLHSLWATTRWNLRLTLVLLWQQLQRKRMLPSISRFLVQHPSFSVAQLERVRMYSGSSRRISPTKTDQLSLVSTWSRV